MAVRPSPSPPQDIPARVHLLLRDMKALEAVLCRWSRAGASPQDVSDAYVQFGAAFNAVVRAFHACDIPTTDLNAIPTQLRSALEDCLGELPSPDALDRCSPGIRRLLAELLRGLRAKQPAWRSAAGRSPVSAYSPAEALFPPGPFP